MATVGERIREERLERSWSQEYLAGRAGVHPTEISRLERDIRQPRLNTVLLVARGFGMSAGKLLDGVEALEAA